ncbi:unnamed protein product [Lota lota]
MDRKNPRLPELISPLPLPFDPALRDTVGSYSSEHVIMFLNKDGLSKPPGSPAPALQLSCDWPVSKVPKHARSPWRPSHRWVGEGLYSIHCPDLQGNRSWAA